MTAARSRRAFLAFIASMGGAPWLRSRPRTS